MAADAVDPRLVRSACTKCKKSFDARTLTHDALELHGMGRKVFLIVDGHPAHKARSVKRFAEAHAERMELFFLPPYAPALDPDELTMMVRSLLRR